MWTDVCACVLQPDFNTTLAGAEEFVVEESLYGVDNSKITEIMSRESREEYTKKPIDRSYLWGTSEFTDTK